MNLFYAALYLSVLYVYLVSVCLSVLSCLCLFVCLSNTLYPCVGSEKKGTYYLKPLEDLDLTQENVMDEIEGGQQPITTLLLVKPSAVQKFLPRILRKIAQEEFSIMGLRLLLLDEKKAELFVPKLKHKVRRAELGTRETDWVKSKSNVK